jgi:integrase
VFRGRTRYAYFPFRGTIRAGKRTLLPGHPYGEDYAPNPDWWEAYRRAAEPESISHRPGTFGALIAAYKASPEWKQRSPRTIKEAERHLAYVAAKWGTLPVDGVEPKHVISLRDTRADTPADANNLIRTLSALMGWASLRGWRGDNPCTRIPKLKIGEGWSPWSWEAIDHFRGTASPRMWQAAALALYTGQRLSDVLAMRWLDIDQGLISVVQGKTGKKLWIPIHKQLQALLDDLKAASEIARAGQADKGKVVDLSPGERTVLSNSRGQPWTVDGFKASWAAELNRDAMKTFRQQRLVFHGLRKSAVVFLLEAGCTDAETAAITGQSRDMVEHYAKQVNQRRLAAAAILKWETADKKRAKRRP